MNDSILPKKSSSSGGQAFPEEAINPLKMLSIYCDSFNPRSILNESPNNKASLS